MTTAFQIGAFQFSAFQQDGSTPIATDTHDAIGDERAHKWHLERYTKNQADLKKLRNTYNEVKETQSAALLAAIEPFVEAKTPHEQDLRSNAQYIIQELPPIDRIDFLSILENKLAIERLEIIIIDILQKKQAIEKQEEEYLLLACMAVMH